MKKTILILAVFTMIVGAAISASAQSEEAVKAILSAYKNANEKLDTTGTGKLFVKNSTVVESGSLEGNYQNYVQHHLGPDRKSVV